MNNFFLKALKRSLKSENVKPFEITKIETSESFNKSLVKKSKLNQRFKSCDSFLSDYHLIDNIQSSTHNE